MILGSSIYSKLIAAGENPKNLRYDFDIRYLQKWIKKYPSIFPKYILSGNYFLKFDWNKTRWEIYKK